MLGRFKIIKRIITIDFETYFSTKEKYSLSNIGPISYVNDERFLPIMMGVRINRSEPVVYSYDEIGEALNKLNLEDPETITVGHNINGFDSLVLSSHYNVHPAQIHDTMVMMRWAGLSMNISESHRSLTEYLEHGIKEHGTEVSDGKRLRLDFSNSEWEFFRSYCSADTLQCSENYFALLPYVTQEALDFCSLTAKMATEPCLRVNKTGLEKFIASLDLKAEEIFRKLADRFHIASAEDLISHLRSKDKFVAMLRQLGVDPPQKVSVAKTRSAMDKAWANGEYASWKLFEVKEPAISKTDSQFLDLLESENSDVVNLIEARLELNSSGPKSKANNLLKVGSNGDLIPIQLAAFKAHTSRYAAGSSEGKGDGLNFQNFPKRNKDMLVIRECLLPPNGYIFVSCDSSQVEARLLAWVANQKGLVQAFRDNRDPYSELAAKIFHCSADEIRKNKDSNPEMKKFRNVGKTAILSAGYGVGKDRFSETLWLQGAKLGDTRKLHDKQAAKALETYHKQNPKIVEMWGKMDQAITKLSKGMTFTWGGPTKGLFNFGSAPLVNSAIDIPSVTLPSGFKLRYPNLRHDFDPYKKQRVWVYDQFVGKDLGQKYLYGGKLTENLIQALAFQLLMWQALEMQKAGLAIKCNIHDAFLVCIPESEAEATKKLMLDCMSKVPEWLKGFPVACEASIGSDFTIA